MGKKRRGVRTIWGGDGIVGPKLETKSERDNLHQCINCRDGDYC